MDTLVQDLRFGLRQLRKSPAFTLAAVLTLALGIGANTTVFNWLNSVIFNPLPGVDSTRLYYIRWRTPEGNSNSFSWPDYLDYRKRNQTLEGLIVGRMTAMSLGDGSQQQVNRVWGLLVSANYFETLGVKAAMGRTFLPEEDEKPGGHPVVVISHQCWQSRFGGDPQIIGKQIRLNKQNFTVIGVTPSPFQGNTLGLSFEMWVPAMMQPTILGGAGILDQRGSRWLDGFARLKPGVTPARAEEDLTVISSQIAREFSQSDRYPRAITSPVWKEGGGRMLAPVMILMMAVVGVVLLIACANISNLLLARSAARRREIGIRLALGVSRLRLIRQLMIESGLLAMLGGAAALAMVPLTKGMLQGFTPVSDFPVGLVVRPDGNVFLFGLAVSALATVLFGLIPALRGSSPDLINGLKDDSGGSVGARKSWLRSSLVVAQVSLSLVLLIAAGLLLKSLEKARNADPGFDPRNVLLAGVDLVPNGYDAPRGRIALRQITERISALPGVTAVSTIRRVPLGLGGSSSSSFEVDGYAPGKNEEMMTFTHTIGPDYFHTLNTPVTAGREFSPAATDQTQKEVVINQTFAQRYFAKMDPVGRTVRIFRESRVVAGVVKDSKFFSLNDPPAPAVYFPVAQVFNSEANFLVRTSGDPLSQARAVQEAIRSVDPNLPVFGVRDMQTAIGVAYFGQRMGGSLLGFFGALALGLAAVGIYGVLAYGVTQRSREIGIRMALGANRGSVLRLILGQGMNLALIGVAIGLVVAVAVTRLMNSMLFGVSPTDVPTMVTVSALLVVVVLAASYLPARKATRIDPILAIRYE